ncbi:hypothetical protein F5146DRAFT_1035780 [Armillaria mellea]|nr:hypothetical protein F5146DRAFT_1035780 [Armillaria mellea]
MLNLGADLVWLDVLCLRQKGGPRDHLRAQEWELDVPTIGDDTDEDWYEGACIEKGRVRVTAEGRHGELVVEGVDGNAHTFKILVPHQLPIPEDTYTLIGSNKQYLDGTFLHSQYWTFGRRLPNNQFEKYSVFKITGRDEIDRLDNLGVTKTSRNILV